jgi:ketosteroid isomerase-like protein
MKHISTFLFVIFFALAAIAQNKDAQMIRQLLATQAEQWNQGNITGFMKGYWESDSLLFVGKAGPKYGYNTTLENYKKSYPDKTAMGKLHFDILKTDALAADTFFVLGKWMLQRSIGNLEGFFTLILKKKKGLWVIVADHSS